MALPLIGGVVGIASAVIDVFVRIYERIFQNKLVVTSVMITLTLALMGTFIGGLHVLIDSLPSQVPTEVVTAWSWFMPANARTCIEACATARAAHWVYWTNRTFLEQKFTIARTY